MEWPRIFWCGGGAATAAALGWAGATLSLAGKAPVGLLSIGIGLALGLVLVGLAEITHSRERRMLIIGTLVFAFLTVLAEHAWLYRAYRQQWWKNRVEQPAVALFRPETEPLSVVAYFRREFEYSPRQGMVWALDAALIASASVGLVILRRCHE